MRMRDAHLDLKGFLEGNRDHPLQWFSISLAREPTSAEWRSFMYFQLRAREFLANVQDIDLGRFPSLAMNRSAQKASVIASAYPGRHRAKSLYLDFRHFLANREPSHFNKVVNALRRNIAEHQPVQEFLKDLKQQFIASQAPGVEFLGQNLKPEELIDVWFNTELFHAGRPDQNVDRQKWLEILEDDSAHQLMFWLIIRASHEVKCLYACVKDLREDGARTINCPDIRIVRRRESQDV